MSEDAEQSPEPFSNDTHNQHFVSRVEQRLNAKNTNASPENMRIFSFRLIDRENYKVEQEGKSGILIGKNLSLRDLFSFDVADAGANRLNFEDLFAKYETNIEVHTRSLLAKLPRRSKDVKAEIIDLFAAKLLNFVRNPYCIQKVLNTFPGISTYEPTDPMLLAAYKRIVEGKKPHQNYLCEKLGISDQMYIAWLRTLFMLLFPNEQQPSLFEALIKSLIENPNIYVSAYVFEYDNKCCLLSDRGYCEMIPDGSHTTFSFNLTSHAFVTYIFSDFDELTKNMPRERVAMSRDAITRAFHITYFKDHFQMLANYNRRVIEQCHSRVFCSAKQFDLLEPGSLTE